MSKKLLDENFPVGTCVGVVNPQTGRGFSMTVVEHAETGTLGIDDDGRKTFLPLSAGCLLIEGEGNFEEVDDDEDGDDDERLERAIENMAETLADALRRESEETDSPTKSRWGNRKGSDNDQAH